MERKVFLDPRVSRLVAERFVAVRVDKDRRPDIDARYSKAGWPTLAWLDDSGELLGADNYLEPRELALRLELVSETYTKSRDVIRARLARADCRGRTGDFDCSAMDWFIERARALGVEREAPAPLLMGRHLLELGLSPGPRIGEVLKAVYEQQLDGAVATLDQAVVEARRIIDEM